MSAAAEYDPLEMFAARAVTAARLWSIGGVSLHDAVDDLAAEAQRAGFDTDMAQEIMSEAFRPFREAAPMNDTDFDDGIHYEPGDSREHEQREESKRARSGNGEQARAKTKHTAGGWKYHSGVSAIALGWLIKDILPEIGAALMAGQWGTYKTTIALEASVCVMADLPFAGRYRIKRCGAVIYFALEGEGMIDARLSAIANHLGVEGPLPFAWRGDCPRLTDNDAVAQLCAMIDAAAADLKREFGLDVVLIWIDTMITAAGYEKGDDSDTATSQKVMNALKAVGRHSRAMVVGIDHFGKVVETGTRGSSAKEGAADTVLALLGDRELSGSVKNTRLAVRKQRDGISGFEMPFTATKVETGTDEDGDPITAVVIDWQAPETMTSKKADTRWTPAMQLLRRVLMTMLADNGHNARPFVDGPEVLACDIELVRNEFYKQQPAEGETEKQKHNSRRQAFLRAFKAAQAKGVISSREVDGVQLIWLCQHEDLK